MALILCMIMNVTNVETAYFCFQKNQFSVQKTCIINFEAFCRHFIFAHIFAVLRQSPTRKFNQVCFLQNLHVVSACFEEMNISNQLQ